MMTIQYALRRVAAGTSAQIVVEGPLGWQHVSWMSTINSHLDDRIAAARRWNNWPVGTLYRMPVELSDGIAMLLATERYAALEKMLRQQVEIQREHMEK